MKVSRLFVSILFVASCCMVVPMAAGAGTAPKVAFSTRFGGVDFLFTEEAGRKATADGGDFQTAIREVGFELISAVGSAAKSSTGLQALLIDGIKYKDKKSFVVLGIVADGKFQSLNVNGKFPSQVSEKFLEELEKNRVVLLRTADAVGVELLISEK